MGSLVDGPTVAVHGGPIGFAVSDELAPVTVNLQCQSEWCWAAVTRAIGDGVFEQVRTLCEVVSTTRKSRCCEASDCRSAIARCNQQTRVQDALDAHGYGYTIVDGRASFERVTDEIRAGRPVPIIVEWDQGGGHVFTVVGVNAEDSQLLVADSRLPDPSDPSRAAISRREYHADTARFDTGGRWTWTFMVRP